MSDDHDSDNSLDRWIPGRPEEPFTETEIRRLRKLLAEDAHATWLRKQIRVFVPWAVAVIGGLVTAYNVLSAHWKNP